MRFRRSKSGLDENLTINKRDLDEKSRIRSKKISIVFLIIGILGIPAAIAQLIFVSQTPIDINNISKGQIKQGAYVNSSIEYVLDCCAIGNQVYTRHNTEYEDEDRKRYYILPVFAEEKTYYMLLEVDNTDRDYKAMEELVEANWSFIMGETERIEAPPILLGGKIENVDSELMGYMRDWFIETDFLMLEDGEELDTYLLPYKVTLDEITQESAQELVVGCIFFLTIGLIGRYIYRDPDVTT